MVYLKRSQAGGCNKLTGGSLGPIYEGSKTAACLFLNLLFQTQFGY